MISWQVIRSEPGRTVRARESLSRLAGIEEVYAPVMGDRLPAVGGRQRPPLFWLGSLVLARWDASDPHMWHDVAECDGVAHILGGWPPMRVSERALQIFRDEIAAKEAVARGECAPEYEEPPCAPGDKIKFTYLDIFIRCEGICLWTDKGVVGVRYIMMGHDHLLPVPYKFVEKKQEIIIPHLGRRKRQKARIVTARS